MLGCTLEGNQLQVAIIANTNGFLHQVYALPTEPLGLNLCELEAAIKGVNMAVKCGFEKIRLNTNSITVKCWLTAVFAQTHNVRTHVLSELLIRRRLDVFCQLKKQGLMVYCHLVKSEDNRADVLTRVPKKWLSGITGLGAAVRRPATLHNVKELHCKHHFGVYRTLELAQQKWGQNVSRRMVKKVVRNSEPCARFDPAVVSKVKKGNLNSVCVWDRLCGDIAHVRGKPFLTLVDSSTRFSCWFELRNESAEEVSSALMQVFAQFGPTRELLTDNGTVFRSADVHTLLLNWEVALRLSCAYRSQGNDLCERNHKTIKVTFARAQRSVQEAVFWYIVTRGACGVSPFT